MLGRAGARIWRIVLGAIAVAIAALTIWGVGIEPRFLLDVRHERAEIPRLPPSLDGARVAAFGDWQLGMWLDNPGMVARAVERALEADADVIVLLGDFVYGSAADDELETVARLLQPIHRSGIPTFAVLGNHDFGVEDRGEAPEARRGERVKAVLERSGVRVLHNEAVPLRSDGRPADEHSADGEDLYLVGIGPSWPGLARVDEAFAAVPRGAPRLVLHHNPTVFPHLPPRAAPVAVAGHTHGGQIRLPFLPQWSWLGFIRPGGSPVDGWIESSYGEPGNRLYVNRGIGFGGVPVRINCQPELTIFELRSAGARGG